MTYSRVWIINRLTCITTPSLSPPSVVAAGEGAGEGAVETDTGVYLAGGGAVTAVAVVVAAGEGVVETDTGVYLAVEVVVVAVIAGEEDNREKKQQHILDKKQHVLVFSTDSC
jgi:hypothetical protein